MQYKIVFSKELNDAIKIIRHNNSDMSDKMHENVFPRAQWAQCGNFQILSETSLKMNFN